MCKPGGVCKDCEAAWMSVAGCTKQKTTGAAAPGYNNELKKKIGGIWHEKSPNQNKSSNKQKGGICYAKRTITQ